MESCDEVEFIFLWMIENVRYCIYPNGTFFTSPEFSLKTLCDTTWRLKLYPNGDKNENENFISCFLCRLDDNGPRNIEVLFKLSTGSTSHKMKHCFIKDEERGIGNFILRKSVLEKESFVIECHMLSSPDNIVTDFYEAMSIHNSTSGLESVRLETETALEIVKDLPKVKREVYIRTSQCFAISQFLVGRLFCMLSIGDLLTTKCKEKQIGYAFPHAKTPSLVITLYVNHQEDCLAIDINLLEANIGEPFLLVCKALILDSDGDAVPSAEEHVFDGEHENEVWHLKGLFKLDDLKQNADTSCSNQLTLSCEFIFSLGYEDSHIEWTSLYERLIPVPHSSLSSQSLRFYNEKKFCDVVLRTGDKTFDVHKVVLCAMSPVFSSMFSSGMTESSTNVVNIDDVEEETVSQMLSFFYTETLGQLEFESAKKLFSAADKYQILPMKEMLRNFMISSMTEHNVCDVLSLANDHSDLKLKNAAIEFFTNHTNDLLLSSEWKAFEEHNRILANEILKEVCQKLSINYRKPRLFPSSSKPIVVDRCSRKQFVSEKAIF